MSELLEELIVQLKGDNKQLKAALLESGRDTDAFSQKVKNVSANAAFKQVASEARELSRQLKQIRSESAAVERQAMSQLRTEANAAKREAREAAAEVRRAQSLQASQQRRSAQGINSAGNIGNALTLGVTVPIVAGGVFAVREFAQLDKYQKAIQSVIKDQKESNRLFEEFRKLANQPAGDLTNITRGFARLNGLTRNSEESLKTITELQNAIAFNAGTSENFGNAILQLSQVLGSGNLQGDELNSLTENVPQIRKIIKEAFGTFDTRALKQAGVSSQQVFDAILSGLAKIPRAQRSAADDLKQFSSSISQSFAALGADLVKNGNLQEILINISSAVREAVGAFTSLPDSVQKGIIYFGLFAAATGPVLSGITRLISLVKEAGVALNALAASRLLSGGLTLGTGALAGGAILGVGALALQFNELKNSLNNASEQAFKNGFEGGSKRGIENAKGKTAEQVRDYIAYLNRELSQLDARAAQFNRQTRANPDPIANQIDASQISLQYGRLRGELNAFREAEKKLGADTGTEELFKKVTDGQAKLSDFEKIVRRIRAELKANFQESKLFDLGFDENATKDVNTLSKGIVDLLGAGGTANNRVVQEFKQLLDTLLSLQKDAVSQIEPLAGNFSTNINTDPTRLPGQIAIETPDSNPLIEYGKQIAAINQYYQYAVGYSSDFAKSQDTVQSKLDATRNVMQQIVDSNIPLEIRDQWLRYLSNIGEQLSSQLRNVTLDISAQVSSLISDFAMLAGQMLVSSEATENFGAKAKEALGSFIISIGQAAIAAGVTALATASAVFNPFAAIAAGTAAVVLGSALKQSAQSSLSSAASGSGSSLSSSSSRSGSSSGSSSNRLDIYVTGELTERNGAVRAAFLKQEKRIQRLSR